MDKGIKPLNHRIDHKQQNPRNIAPLKTAFLETFLLLLLLVFMQRH